ncbi:MULTISPECIES: ribosome-inactivating family protein [Streptomyces]|uniref:Uncharacterized protein n=1 Tax=Streptomyces luteosporeus TaxID=173856 RepID=A0ABP6GP24_9ACTN
MRTSRLARSLLMTGLGLAVTVTGTVASTGTAEARTDWRHLSHVYMNLSDDGAGERQRIDYSNFLASLRAAAAGPNGMETQLEDFGLIRVTLGAPDDRHVRREASFWINPANLYVWGFSNENGITYQFNDINGALRTRMAETTTPAPGVNTDVRTLNFGSNYNSLSGTANRGRENMPISWNDIRASIVQLATADNPSSGSQRENTARSLSLMIQMLSEAARFNDVEGTFRAAMGTWGVQHLPQQQQELENAWAALSENWQRSSARLQTTPVRIPSIGNVNGTDQVRRYVRLSLGRPGLTRGGDWGHDEL